jgi:hypothetical protein
MIESFRFPSIICHYQLSNEKLTVKVVVRNGKIKDAAPVIKCFIGQPLDNLAAWMRKIGPTDVHLLATEEDTAKNRDPYA